MLPPAVEPPPELDDAHRAGSLNIGRLEPSITAPSLPEPEQRARWVQPGQARARANHEFDPGRPPALPAAMSSGTHQGSSAVENIVALGLNPMAPSGPVAVPLGSRHGEFAAGPEGKPGASGIPQRTPNAAATGQANLDRGTVNAGAAEGKDKDKAPPLAGITVAAGPVNPGPATMAGPSVEPAPAAANAAKPGLKPLLAALQPMRASDIARQTRPGIVVPPAPPPLEAKVFGARKYYQMTLNMPNFTSSGGSWVVHFAELKPAAAPGELIPPVATVKVDPAYPAEAQRQRLTGVVILYAIIHADGSVGQVRLLHGVDDLLDASARAALERWRFRPGMRNGTAVELEAIVDIPFRPGNTGLE
jgi:protein TonB